MKACNLRSLLSILVLLLSLMGPILRAEQSEPLPPASEDRAAPDSTHTEDLEAAPLAQAWKAQIEELLHKARIALRLQKPELAEQFFIEALNKQMPDAQRKRILLELADVFEGLKRYAKLCSVYEKYIDLYPKDAKVGDLYFRLAEIYRSIGAPEKAIERYYNILNLSLSAKEDQFNALKESTLEAQMSIAETYLSIEKFMEAKLFFSRLKHLKLPKNKEETIDFKLAYCAYSIQDYKSALMALQEFIYNYPQSGNLPEAYSMLVDTYHSLKMPDKAQEAVKVLFSLPQTALSSATLLFWQKKTANQLANAFYKKEDFMAALKIYQAMLSLSSAADWQWPIIYQMGLCYEKLSMYPKAQEAYSSLIVQGSVQTEATDGPEGLTDYLKSIQDMAQWRKDHLGWMLESESQVQALFKMPQLSSAAQ